MVEFWYAEKKLKSATKKLERRKRRSARRNAEGAGEGLGGVKNDKIEAKDQNREQKAWNSENGKILTNLRLV